MKAIRRSHRTSNCRRKLRLRQHQQQKQGARQQADREQQQQQQQRRRRSASASVDGRRQRLWRVFVSSMRGTSGATETAAAAAAAAVPPAEPSAAVSSGSAAAGDSAGGAPGPMPPNRAFLQRIRRRASRGNFLARRTVNATYGESRGSSSAGGAALAALPAAARGGQPRRSRFKSEFNSLMRVLSRRHPSRGQCCGGARGKGGRNSSRMQTRICESFVEMLMDWDGGGQRVKTGARKAPAQRCRMLMAETEMGLGVTGSAPS
ncbi:uncharacterized protein LOC34621386 [Cyclospora cayetanensis]|uniref:Uncharacterized protein LOC34621386 n=1 Tax=Cyclospora cayetanensis TaxID=88456 RepID=A0A6P6S0E2_9EIME|nr:uncharacterized protein LOC34621386 [Cyclospora cayetanensis]